MIAGRSARIVPDQTLVLQGFNRLSVKVAETCGKDRLQNLSRLIKLYQSSFANTQTKSISTNIPSLILLSSTTLIR